MTITGYTPCSGSITPLVDVGLRVRVYETPDCKYGRWCGSVRDSTGNEIYTCNTDTRQQSLADATEAARAIRGGILRLMARSN